jgi:site-specific DNA-methyltransferase (adenine-specific)
MEIINIDINKLKPYKNNPRKNDEAVEYVANSIKEFGFKVPIIVDKDYEIIAGHTRLKAAKQLGLKEVPIIIADDLTEEQVKAFRLADNKVSEIAEWDFNLLDNELSNILDIDMSNFGFDVFEEEEEQEIIEDDFEVIVPEEPKAKLGVIYQLGRHRLMCGDSTSVTDVEKLVNGNIMQMSFTSPPYNVGANIGYENRDSKYANDDDNKTHDEYVQFLIDFTNNCIQNSDYTFVNIQSLANNKISLINYLYKMQDYYADTMIWDKGFGPPAIAKNVMNSAFEYIHIFSKNATRVVGTKEFHGTIPNVLHIGSQRKNEYADIHNATFSIEFVSFFIENFTNKNEYIMDLFGGTGTTLIACEQLNRTCFMMEIDPKYCDVIIDRWEALTGEKAELLDK